jgi:hypothetical protein
VNKISGLIPIACFCLAGAAHAGTITFDEAGIVHGTLN